MDILETLLFSQWLLISSLSVLSDMNQIICDGVVYFNQYHEKQLLFGTLNEPINLVTPRLTSELFFSHKIQSGNTFHRKIRVCDLDYRNCTDIEIVTEGRAIAYDRIRDRVFFGGIDGIFLYNRLTHSAHFFAEAYIPIWTLFVKDFFYYVATNSKRLHINTHVNFTGKFKIFPIMEDYEVDNYYVSTYNAMYFSNTSGLYKAYTPTREIFALNKTMNVRQISQNFYKNYSSIFFVVPDGIYIQDKIRKRMARIAPINQPYGLTFRNISKNEHEINRFEIIYSDHEAIYKLVKSHRQHTCLKELRPKKQPYQMDLDLMVNYD